MILTVDANDPTPPFEQLRVQLSDLIHSGVLTVGTRLPPVRQLAADLGLATGTVARTYRELEALGLLQTRRGGGTTVADTAPAYSTAQRRSLVEDALRQAVQQARRLGASDDDITRALRTALG